MVADINDCSEDPCLNGGICNDGVNTYDCTCTMEWTGETCEFGMWFMEFSVHLLASLLANKMLEKMNIPKWKYQQIRKSIN